MKSYAAVYHVSIVPFLHVPIHFCIYQSKNNSFVAHQSLIVAFGIANGFFIYTSICEFPENMSGFPVFVFYFFNILYPEIRYTHCHPKVKANTTIGVFCCKTGHAAYFLGNSYSIWFHFVYQFICQCKVANSITILIQIIIR